MKWPELGTTLTALVEAFAPPADSAYVLTRIELRVPLEVTTAPGRKGPTVLARAPHSRWSTGVLPPVHMGHLVIGPWDPAAWSSEDGVDHGR